MTDDYTMLGISSMLHLLVDGLCMCSLFLLSSLTDYSVIINALIIYNVLAFLTQPFTGLMADKMPHRHWLLLTSNLILTLASLATLAVALYARQSEGAILTVAILLGIGNSLFHVWGGKQTAVTTGNDMRALGIFVSTGAFGLALGMLFCSWSLLYVFLLSIVFLSALYLIRDSHSTVKQQPSAHPTLRLPLIIAAILALMAFVMMRSLAGEAFSSAIARTNATVLLIGFVAMAGKMAGGWIARWLGIVPALALLLVVAPACYLARGLGMSTLLVGLFAINCTMPITLYLANVVLKGKEGLAFGLLAAALIPGYLLAMLK